jgi:hypothetical protein
MALLRKYSLLKRRLHIELDEAGIDPLLSDKTQLQTPSYYSTSKYKTIALNSHLKVVYHVTFTIVMQLWD